MEPLTCNFCGRKMMFFRIREGELEIMCRHSDCKRINKLLCKNGVCIQVLTRPVVDNSSQYKKIMV